MGLVLYEVITLLSTFNHKTNRKFGKLASSRDTFCLLTLYEFYAHCLYTNVRHENCFRFICLFIVSEIGGCENLWKISVTISFIL